MVLVLGTNCGFVTEAPTADPLGSATQIDTKARMHRDTAPETAAKVTEIGWWCGTASQEANFEVAIYVGDSASSATIVGVSRTNAKGTTAGWKVVTGLNISITAGTKYWMAVQLDDTATTTYTDYRSSGGEYLVRKDSQTTLPSPWGSSSSSVPTYLLAVYAVWEEAGGEEYDETYSESFSFSDSPTKQSVRILSDNFSFSDSPTKQSTRTLSESQNLSEDYSKVWNVLRTLSESNSLSDNLINSISRILLESFSLSDGDAADITRILAESLNISDAYLRVWDATPELTETINLTDVRLMAKIMILSESLSLYDDFERLWTSIKGLTESFNLADVRLMDTARRPLTESLSLSDEFEGLNILFKSLSESLSLSDSKLFDLNKLCSESFSISDGDFYQAVRELTESFNLTRSILKEIQKEFGETANLSDSKILSIERELQEIINISDVLLKLTAKSFSESLILTEPKVDITSGLIFNESFNLSDSYSRVWSAVRTYSEIINITAEFFRYRFAELMEEFNMTDNISKIWGQGRTFLESFNLKDSFLKVVQNWLRLAAARSDIQSIITNQGIEATLIRQTETTDSVGAVTAVSEEEYTIYMSIQDILREDRQIHEMGLAFPGSAKVFLFHEYPDSITGNGDINVLVGDMIKDDEDKYWRVEKIEAEREMEGSEVFKSAIIKRIGLDQ